jgi:putative nucleotidyltransferase with HDIG domain
MTVAVPSRPPPRLSSRERVELIFRQIDQLPTLPAVAARLLEVTTSNESCAREAIELIESDASLTAMVLKMTRSAELGVSGKGMTVERAVTLLGFDRVRNAALSVQVMEALLGSDGSVRNSEKWSGIWAHSLATACVAEAIAKRIGSTVAAGNAFVCGLLHDIGKIALYACLPKAYDRVLDTVERRRDCICDVERSVLGLDHAVAGKRLTARWQLPDCVIETAWLHHQEPHGLPASVVHRKLVYLIHTADQIVRNAGIGFSGYQHICETESLTQALGLSPDDVNSIVERLPEQMAPFQALLGLEDDSCREDYSAGVAAANRKLGEINAQLIDTNRRLSVRSQCLTAIEDFTSRLTETDYIGEVGIAAAQSVRAMLRSEMAMAFCYEEDRCNVHVSQSEGRDSHAVSAVMDLTDDKTAEAWKQSLSGTRRTGFTPAPHGFENVWLCCNDTLPSAPLWLLPFESGAGYWAGVVVAAPEESVAPFLGSEDTCASLSTSMGLALSSARTRARSEEMNDELLDLNRQVRHAQQELVRARTISMIGSMAGGAAHELNNPLSVISGRAQMALTNTQDEESLRAFRIIIEQTQRATAMIADLMQFAKPEPATLAPLPLLGLLEPACQHWRTHYGLREDQITLDLFDDEVTVLADGGQLHQVLSAIVENAVEAMDSETAHLHINSPAQASDETVRIVIEDNGVGMTPEVVEHAFDPFFSARPAGRGRGLGLSQAFRLVENQDGRLRIDSTPGVGTVVTIELPAFAPNDQR